MALNNLERLASQGERAALFRLLDSHPGALHLLAKLGGTSQFLADTLRRRPTLLPWLLEPGTMRQWYADDLEAELEQSARAFDRPEARWNALRRFKYRQLLRIGCRDILGDADLTVTTEELSRMADVCLAAAWRWTEEDLRERYGDPQWAPTGRRQASPSSAWASWAATSSTTPPTSTSSSSTVTTARRRAAPREASRTATTSPAAREPSRRGSSPSRTKATPSASTFASAPRAARAASSSRSRATARTSRSARSCGSARR